MLYMSLSTHRSPIFGTKPLPRRRFLQHYYRYMFIESHQKPIDVPQISYTWSPNLQHAYSQKMKKWLFIQITPINHHFTNQNLHICDIFCTFAADLNLFYFLKKPKLAVLKIWHRVCITPIKLIWLIRPIQLIRPIRQIRLIRLIKIYYEQNSTISRPCIGKTNGCRREDYRRYHHPW